MWFPYAVLAVFGLIAGSFLNVCIWRVPRGQSIVAPSSRCPSCGVPIGVLDNIPVLSYLLLAGRCRHCGGKISPRYPVVEAVNALLYMMAFNRFGAGWHLPFYLAFVSLMIVVAFIDLDFQIIPDRITLPGIPVGLIAGSLILPDPLSRMDMLGYKASLAGAATGFGLFYAVAIVSRGGMGGGDIKLMTMIGALLGWKTALITTLLGSFTGSIVGIFLMAFRGKGRKTKIPFGPFLAFGALITLFFGQEIFGWYAGMHKR